MAIGTIPAGPAATAPNWTRIGRADTLGWSRVASADLKTETAARFGSLNSAVVRDVLPVVCGPAVAAGCLVRCGGCRSRVHRDKRRMRWPFVVSSGPAFGLACKSDPARSAAAVSMAGADVNYSMAPRTLVCGRLRECKPFLRLWGGERSGPGGRRNHGRRYSSPGVTRSSLTRSRRQGSDTAIAGREAVGNRTRGDDPPWRPTPSLSASYGNSCATSRRRSA